MAPITYVQSPNSESRSESRVKIKYGNTQINGVPVVVGRPIFEIFADQGWYNYKDMQEEGEGDVIQMEGIKRHVISHPQGEGYSITDDENEAADLKEKRKTRKKKKRKKKKGKMKKRRKGKMKKRKKKKGQEKSKIINIAVECYNLSVTTCKSVREYGGGENGNTVVTNACKQNPPTRIANPNNQHQNASSRTATKQSGDGGDGGDGGDDRKVDLVKGHYLEAASNDVLEDGAGSDLTADNSAISDLSISTDTTDEVTSSNSETKSLSNRSTSDSDIQMKSLSNRSIQSGSDMQMKSLSNQSTSDSDMQRKSLSNRSTSDTDLKMENHSGAKSRLPKKVPIQEEGKPLTLVHGTVSRTINDQQSIQRKLMTDRLYKLEELEIERIEKLNGHGVVLHAVHCSTNNCRQGQPCFLVKVLVGHFNNHRHQLVTCHHCQVADAMLFLHSINCNLDGGCEVPCCLENRTLVYNSVQQREERRRATTGVVLYSKTLAFEKGEVVNEGIDYCFLFKKHVGGGTYGQVYRSWFYDLKGSFQGDIALKEVRYKTPWQYHAGKFYNEANLLEELDDGHPSIIRTFAMIHLENLKMGLVFMERCECNLLELIYGFRKKHNTKGFPIQCAIYYFRQIASVVAYIHQKGFIHKDLKAKNILLTSDLQRIKLADFDTVMKLVDEVTAADIPKRGTPGYAAPEVLERLPHGRPADVYSLIVVLLELLYGNQCIKYVNEEVRRSEIDDLVIRDNELADLVIQGLQENPMERPTAKNIENHHAVVKYLEGGYKPDNDPNMVCRDMMTLNQPERIGLDDVQENENALERIVGMKDMTNECIEKLMDDLPKELRSINQPKISEWIERAQPDDAYTDAAAATNFPQYGY